MAGVTGRTWMTNAERRSRLTAPPVTPRFTLPSESDLASLEARETKSVKRAFVAGRLYLRRSERSVHVRGIDQTFMIVS